MLQKFQKAEQIFIPTHNRKTTTKNLEKFITENFQVPDNDLERICRFIRKDCELEKIMFELPSLIKSKISYEKLKLKFYNEFNDEFLQLEIIIFEDIDIKNSLRLEDELEYRLYEMYDNNSADKLLIMME